MASEITVKYLSGRSLYFHVLRSGGQLWNPTDSAWQAPNASPWAEYKIALTESGTTGYYIGNMPTWAVEDPKTYSIIVLEETTPGTPDALDLQVSGGPIGWDGANVVDPVGLLQRVLRYSDGTPSNVTYEEALLVAMSAVACKTDGARTATPTVYGPDNLTPVFEQVNDGNDRTSFTKL